MTRPPLPPVRPPPPAAVVRRRPDGTPYLAPPAPPSTRATTTPKLGLIKPEVGGDDNVWGYYLNSNADTIDSGVLLLTGGTVTGDVIISGTLSVNGHPITTDKTLLAGHVAAGNVGADVGGFVGSWDVVSGAYAGFYCDTAGNIVFATADPALGSIGIPRAAIGPDKNMQVYGKITVGLDPVGPDDVATKRYVDALGGGTGGGGAVNGATAGQLAFYSASGNTVSGTSAITVAAGAAMVAADPTAALGIATKAYVDAHAGGGGGGSGTVNSGTAGQLAFYGATGAAVSGSATVTIPAAGRAVVGTVTDDAASVLQVGGNVTVYGSLTSQSPGPIALQMFDTAAAVDEKRVDIFYSGTALAFCFPNDLNSTLNPFLNVARSGVNATTITVTAAGSVNFVTPALLQNGVAVGGTGSFSRPASATSSGTALAMTFVVGGGDRAYDTTLTGNCVFTLTGGTAGQAQEVWHIIRGGAGGFTATLPSGVKWPGGVVPTVDTSAGSYNEFFYRTVDGGTTVSGNY